MGQQRKAAPIGVRQADVEIIASSLTLQPSDLERKHPHGTTFAYE